MPDRNGPPPGVPIQHPSSSFEEETPTGVGAPPDQRRATRGDIRGLEQQLKDHNAQDMRDIGELKSKVERVDGKVEKVDGKVDDTIRVLGDVRDTLGDVRAELATTSTHVESIVRNQKANLRISTAHEVAATEDQADVKKRRREIWYAIVKVAAMAIVGWAIGRMLEIGIRH